MIKGGSISRVASVVVHNSRRSGREQSSKCLSISRCRRGSRDGRPQTSFCRSGDGGSSGGVDNRGISGSGRRGVDIRDGIRRVDNRDGRRRVDYMSIGIIGSRSSDLRSGSRRIIYRSDISGYWQHRSLIVGCGRLSKMRQSSRSCNHYRISGPGGSRGRVDPRSGNRNGRRRVDSRCGKGGRGRRRKNARCCSRYRVGGSGGSRGRVDHRSGN